MAQLLSRFQVGGTIEPGCALHPPRDADERCAGAILQKDSPLRRILARASQAEDQPGHPGTHRPSLRGARWRSAARALDLSGIRDLGRTRQRPLARRQFWARAHPEARSQ